MRVSELLNEDGANARWKADTAWAQANKPESCPKCGSKDSYRDDAGAKGQALKCARCGKVHATRSYEEHMKVTEAAKPKGTVDKTSGKGRPTSKATEKAGFKVGQRVAIGRGMGRTEHGNVHAVGIKSGGDEGAMVHFGDGKKEYHPYKSLKDASQHWKDEDDKMRAERKTK